MVVCTLPKLIAAYHVLHRLLAPRHPLYALNNLIPFLEIDHGDAACLRQHHKFAVVLSLKESSYSKNCKNTLK